MDNRENLMIQICVLFLILKLIIEIFTQQFIVHEYCIGDQCHTMDRALF